jgi:hypothetical protein
MHSGAAVENVTFVWRKSLYTAAYPEHFNIMTDTIHKLIKLFAEHLPRYQRRRDQAPNQYFRRCPTEKFVNNEIRDKSNTPFNKYTAIPRSRAKSDTVEKYSIHWSRILCSSHHPVVGVTRTTIINPKSKV